MDSYPQPPPGCTNEDLLRLIDLCPFLACDRIQYNDEKVLKLLRHNPKAACLRAPFHRFGIGTDLHPLALVVALGGSLDVVKIMADACPEALGERLSGRRTLLHYAISEGVDVEIIKFLVHKYPEYLTQTDSYNAIPLHLAAFYPSTSVHVLQHLLNLHPRGAKSLDNQSMTPLHRACKSRSSLPKVITLVEAAPCVLSWRDWCGNTPLELADRMDHRLGDIIPEVVGLLELVEETMQLRLDPGNALDSNRTNIDVRRQRAGEVLMRFRFIGWQSGIPMAFAHNIHLFDLMAVPTILNPELLSCFSSNKTVRVENDEPENNDASNITGTNRLNALYSLLKHQPWICGGGM